MKQKEFLKMVENGDVDDTAEFWREVYKSIYQEGQQSRQGEIDFLREEAYGR